MRRTGRRILDWLARRFGYVPAALARPTWQRISFPMDLPPLEPGGYLCSTWVSVHPGRESWFIDGTQLERKPGEVPFIVTRAGDGEIVEAGYRRG